MYSKTKLSVKVKGKLTNSFNSNIGVRQGDNLSPILFNIYVNDLIEYINQTDRTDPVDLSSSQLNALMYADDVVLISKSESGLQNCINAINKFSEDWKMEINLDKTKVIIFNKKGHLIQRKFWLNKDTVKCTDSYTYLGLNFKNTGNLKNTMKDLHKKGLKALFKLEKLLDNNSNIETTLHVFDHTVKPVLLYASEVWGYSLSQTVTSNPETWLKNNIENNPIAQLEIKFYKRLLKVKRNTATLGVRGELGRYPLTIYALCNFFQYLHSLALIPDSKLVKKALQESKLQDEQNTKSLYTIAKNTANFFGLSMNPNISSKHNLNRLKRGTIKTLQAHYRNHWSKQINSMNSQHINRVGGNKLRTYNKLKTSFHMEPYLSTIENEQHRKAVTQLRLSSHPLNIEAQRGIITNPKDRICQLCDENQTENEFHFTMCCPAYQTQRIQLIDQLHDANANLQNLSKDELFIWLLTNEDKATTKLLGRYLSTCFDIRREKNNNRPTPLHTSV